MLFKIFIDYQELFYQAFSNNIFFWNLYQQSILVVFRCSGTTDNLIRIEQGKNAGTISLEFYGTEDLERLSAALEKLSI